MSKTLIEWADHTINPIRARNLETGAVGHFCEKVSPECANCYASDWNERVRPQASGKLIGTGLSFLPVNRAKVETFLDRSKLEEVLRRKKPTRYFWCDMTDLFGEWVPDAMIDACFAVMALTPHHTHMVLTKRADRMRAYMAAPERGVAWLAAIYRNHGGPVVDDMAYQERDAERWPKRSWLGTVRTSFDAMPRKTETKPLRSSAPSRPICYSAPRSETRPCDHSRTCD
jgi:protein gp37